jgi:Alpha amylase, catalytic domain
MQVRANPTVYEINTASWLLRLGRSLGRPAQLGDVPGAEWDALAGLPVDAVWLMGVWQRSPMGREVALAAPQLRDGYRFALPDVHEDDVLGSPYCVRDYVVDGRFGGPAGLAAAREQLRRRGIALILDYVPNHVAADHPRVTQRLGCFLAGNEDDLTHHPEAFMFVAGGVYAKGRDPCFEPWQDVLQLNAFSPELRHAAAETVAAIGDQCDGVRCDMAMLMTNEVFARTWGDRAGPVPDAEYWPALIAGRKETHPDFLFMAEVYWTWKGRCNSRALTSATTSGYTTGSSTTRRSQCAAICGPTPVTKRACSGSSRTTTSPGRRSRSDPRAGRPPPR